MALDFRNYKTLSEGNKEFTRSDQWEVQIINPTFPYYPGDQIISQRCTGVTPSVPGNVNSIEHNIRGFTIIQGTLQNTSGTCSLQFVDREDVGIRKWVDDWKQMIGNRDTTKGQHKANYSVDMIVRYYNNVGVMIYSIKMLGCILADGIPNEDGTNEPSSSSDITISLRYEHYERVYMNAEAQDS